MSITAQLIQVTSDQVKKFRASPEAAYAFLFGDLQDRAAQTSRDMAAWKIRNAPVLLQTILSGATEGLDPAARVAFEKAHGEFGEIARQAVLQAMKVVRQPKARKKAEGISLEKAWHGIHFLLSGQAEGGKPPLAWAVFGVAEIADRQGVMGYGPARVLTPEQVKRVAAALSKVNQKALRSRFDAKAMQKAEVYAVRGEIEFEYLWAHLVTTKAYYAQAAKLGRGMLCGLR